MITLLNQQEIALDEKWVDELMSELLTLTDYPSFDLGILFTTNKDIATYNKKYRNESNPTDILSFSYYPDHTPGTQIEAPSEEEQNLGDLILSLEYIHDYCEKEKVLFEHRVMILLIHGLCHLLGYDHETDQQYTQMQVLEEKLLNQLPTSLRR